MIRFDHIDFCELASVDRESIDLTSACIDLSCLSFLSDLKTLKRLKSEESDEEWRLWLMPTAWLVVGSLGKPANPAGMVMFVWKSYLLCLFGKREATV